MKKVVVNIGLNIGAEEPKQQLSRTLTSLLGYYALDKVRTDEEGVYKGSGERTLIACFEASCLGTLKEALEYLCSDLKQECIACKVNGVGAIVFNTNYEGERFEFNEEYFINF